MTQQHPITPTHQLLQQWNNEAIITKYREPRYTEFIATRAAQWGADQELEACCEWMESCRKWLGKDHPYTSDDLRAVRRPKPPSLAEEALEAQQRLWDGKSTHDDWHVIRRALERLQELEAANG